MSRLSDLVKTMLAQPPALVTEQDIAEYKREVMDTFLEIIDQSTYQNTVGFNDELRELVDAQELRQKIEAL